jgi:protocatechuate 3,4-dioxygenase beta subunit
MRSIPTLIVLLSINALAPSNAHAQNAKTLQCRGIVHGIVSDQRGRPVPGTRVVLSPVGVDLDFVLPEAETNQLGEYRFAHVCPGRYTVLPNGLKLVRPRDLKYLNARHVFEAKLTDKIHVAEIPVRLPTRDLPSR